ncbi:MAG: hypothetical protein J6S67_02840 [Methanobrevibacter sp.]|nr:hypothetical protein [Methanobrevibacter sp.]
MKSMSCKERSIDVAEKVEEVLKGIVKADLKPEEDSALFLHTSLIILKQIMYNTAIIADYVKDKELKGGNN